jgi:hypothetical protein
VATALAVENLLLGRQSPAEGPDVQKELANLDVAIMGGSPEDFRAYLENELKQWSAISTSSI